MTKLEPQDFGAGDARFWLILSLALLAVIVAFLLPKIPQDPGYHEFADARTFLGLRSFCDVLSNLAFVAAGALGLRKYGLSKSASLHPQYLVYCLAVIAVGVGSARYHYDPTTGTLVWDRLAMAVTIIAALAMVVGDRLDAAWGRRMLWPGTAIGVGSVLYWRHTELQGAGDLRVYALVQFLPLALLIVILFTYRSRRLRSGFLWASLALYAMAKVCEHFDRWFYETSGFVSGHTLKHLLAAGGAYLVIGSLVGKRRGKSYARTGN